MDILHPSGTKNRSKLFILKILGAIVLVVIVIMASGMGAMFLFRKYPKTFGMISAVQDATEREKKNLVEQVNRLISLPTDEEPTIATVSDVEKLQAQPFFAKAQNGDKVLIYSNAKKVILYRPSENRIVDVGAVNIKQQITTDQPVLENTQDVVSATRTPTPKPTITPTPEASE